MSKLSWRTKLMVLSALILGALLLFQVFYVLPYIRNREVEMTHVHQKEIARNIARELDIDLLRIKNRLTRIAERAEFRNMDIANQQETMIQHEEISLFLTSLSVMNAEGWFVSGSVDDLSPYTTKSYADRPYFTVPFEQGEVYFGLPRFYPHEGIVGTSISIPIESDTGERVGVLLGGMLLNELIERVRNYPLDERTVAYLVDREGTVVAHSGMDLFALEEGPLSLNFSDCPLVRAIMDGEMSGSREHEHENTPYFGSHVILESNGWGVAVEAPMRAVLAKSDVLVRQLLSVNIALFAMALTVLLVLTQQIVAQRKRAEEQLQRYAAELERANEEVKHFAYIVSHDLRAPLVNLKGFAAELRFALEAIDSAMNAALPHLDEKQRQAVNTALQEDAPEALGFIDSSVTRMDRFINALLKLSRLGYRELTFEPVNMDALVQTTLKTLAHQIEERRVRVTVGPLPEVIADRISMEQIVGNLLTNAVLYLHPDRSGEIEITAARGPSTGSGRGGDETTFHVRDNGRGIAEGDMDKVFAPFRRAGRQDVPGEGMGLAYVETLVRRHGGRIWCESELDIGTTFTFTISNHLT